MNGRNVEHFVLSSTKTDIKSMLSLMTISQPMLVINGSS